MVLDSFISSYFIVVLFCIIFTPTVNSFSLGTKNMVSFHSICVGRRLFARTIAKPVTDRIIRLYSTGNDNDSVVSRCTQKISSLLNPLKILVTSSNEDPNGSHVLLYHINLYFFWNREHVLSISFLIPDSNWMCIWRVYWQIRCSTAKINL